MSKTKKIIIMVLVCASLFMTLFTVPLSAASSDSLLVFSVTNWRGNVPYTYLGFFDDTAGSLDQLHYYSLDNGSSDYVIRFDIPKVAYKGDKFVFSGEMVIHESVKTFTPTCSFPSTLQLTNSHFIDPESTEGFYKYNFVLSCTIPEDTTEFDSFISITSSSAQNGFYIRKVDYSINNDPSVSINDNADKNTSEIIDNQNQNTQAIIGNQNQNTQATIGNQNELAEKEKTETQNQGQDSINDVSGAIEDKSEGFISAISNLVGSMGYNGTDCAWSFPALKLPAIEGVMPEYQLTEEQPIDFEFWVNKIPADILLLVRSLLTIALIGYCFKELYGTISYVLTLKGGGNNE